MNSSQLEEQVEMREQLLRVFSRIIVEKRWGCITLKLSGEVEEELKLLLKS